MSIVAARPIERPEGPGPGLRVYALADPVILSDAAPAIAQALFGMNALQDGGRIFDVHPTSGRLHYADHDALWKNENGRGLAADARAVEALARAFLEDARRKLSGIRALREHGLGELLPNELRPLWIGAVMPEAGAAADHWLCRFSAVLPLDHARSARVEGAAVDLRIGRQNRIIGFSTRWRPIIGDLVSPPLGETDQNAAPLPRPAGMIVPPQPLKPGIIAAPAVPAIAAVVDAAPKDDHHDHGGSIGGDAAAGEVLYWLADDNAPQNFLAPVRLTLNGHHGQVDPACRHALVLELFQRRAESGIEVLAAVAGGSGDVQYRWAIWSPSSDASAEPITFGNEASILVPTGAWTITLLVEDKVTGAVAQAERQVFAHAEETGR
jgi:hypothetical protein